MDLSESLNISLDDLQKGGWGDWSANNYMFDACEHIAVRTKWTILLV